MAFILDTDLLTILPRQSQPACAVLQERMRRHPPAEFVSTIVNFQEQVQGWLTALGRFKDRRRTIQGYRGLLETREFLAKMEFLPFNEAAQDRFEDLRRQGVRIGTLDLRIASISLETEHVHLSRNLKDFQQVPGLQVEDWTT